MFLFICAVQGSLQYTYTNSLTKSFINNAKGKPEISFMFTKVRSLKEHIEPTEVQTATSKYKLPDLKWYFHPIYSIGLPLMLIFICEIFYISCVTNTYWITNPEYNKTPVQIEAELSDQTMYDSLDDFSFEL